MKRATLMLAALALLLGGTGQVKADFIYNLTPLYGFAPVYEPGRGNTTVAVTITGTITVDRLGSDLTANDITAFSFTFNAPPFSSVMVGGTTVTGTQGEALLMASSDSLSFLPGVDATLQFLPPQPNTLNPVYISSPAQSGQLYTALVGAIDTVSGNPETIDINVAINGSEIATTAAPEPSGLTLLGTAAVTLAGYVGWRRRKKPVPG